MKLRLTQPQVELEAWAELEPMGVLARGAKSGGTGEPGSQKVYWPAESFWNLEEKPSL